MTTKRRILFLVDFKYRDLPGLALVKWFLKSKYGYEVLLVPNVPGVSENVFVPTFKPHLVVYPQFVHPATAARAEALKRQGISICVIPVEGMSYFQEDCEQSSGKFGGLLNSVDLFFVWNEMIADVIETYRTLPPKRYSVAGVPRFDFYHPRFRKLFMTKQELCRKYGLDPSKPIVTWATNSPLTNYHGNQKGIAALSQRYQDRHLDSSPLYQDIPDLVRRDVRTRQIHTEAFLRLAKHFPEVNFIIKVHPGEKIQWYQTMGQRESLKNLAIFAWEYIWDVLVSTNVHLHRACMTAIEAYLLGKPAIDLQLNPEEWLFSEKIAEGGDAARTEEELTERVLFYLEGGSIPTEKALAREKIIHWWCGVVDGNRSEYHADRIHQFFETSKDDSKIRWTPLDLKVLAKVKLKQLVGLEIYHSFGAWLKGEKQDPRGKHITQMDVEEWTGRIGSVLNGKVSQRDLRLPP